MHFCQRVFDLCDLRCIAYHFDVWLCWLIVTRDLCAVRNCLHIITARQTFITDKYIWGADFVYFLVVRSRDSERETDRKQLKLAFVKEQKKNNKLNPPVLPRFHARRNALADSESASQRFNELLK